MTPLTVRLLAGLLVSVFLVTAVTGIVALLRDHIPPLNLLVLYLLIVMPVAIVWGTGLGTLTAILSSAAYAYFFLPPIHSFGGDDLRVLIALGAFILTATVVGELSSRMRRAARESARLSKEHAALRRVATLVARAAPPATVFTAVTEEVGRLLAADISARAWEGAM